MFGVTNKNKIMINHYPINNRLFSELDRFVTEAFSQKDISSCEGVECTSAGNPESDDTESTGWNLRLELPGFKKDEVKLTVNDDFLIVTAETEDEARDFLNKIERRVRISDEVDVEKIEARLEDGLLYLEIPKRAKAEPKTIMVN